MIRAGDVVSLAIEKPAAGGRMIARHEGRVVLVRGAIPGERVRARVSHMSRGVAHADAVSVEEPSPDRREWRADPLCGGCGYGHIAYPRQLDIKAAVIADAFARIGRLPLASAVGVAASPEQGYRMRARLHVRGPRWGFFREGTHEVCDARTTGQLLPATCDALDRIVAAARSLALESLQEIELAENADCSNRAVWLGGPSPFGRRALDRLAQVEQFSGVGAADGVRGNPYVSDVVEIGPASIRLRRHVQAFFQGNRFLLSALAAHVAGQIPSGGEVLDLYAGGGLFSAVSAAVRGAHVVAVEGDRIAAADLSFNAAALTGVTAVHGAVEPYLAGGARRRFSGPFTIIADPPRTGLSPDAAKGVLGIAPARLVYVSCDVATLARDARHIVDAGYTLTRLDAFDLFPNTPHVETIAVFDR